MDKENRVYLYRGILFNYKEWNFVIYRGKVVGIREYYFKWNELDL